MRTLSRLAHRGRRGRGSLPAAADEADEHYLHGDDYEALDILGCRMGAARVAQADDNEDSPMGPEVGEALGILEAEARWRPRAAA